MDSSTVACGSAKTSTVSCVGFMDRALALEQTGRSVIHMEKGELDFDTPEVIKLSAVAALDAGHTRYADSRGLLPLRAAIGAYYARVYGVTVSPDRVFVTSGSSPALLAALLATASAGDHVVLPDPGYPAYRTMVELAGARPVPASTARDGFRVLAASMLRHVTPSTTVLLVNSPSNPTGSIVADGELAQLARSGLTVISDEVYEPLVFDDAQRRSILQHSDDAVVVNSFSKAFAMTGWRLGYAIVPDGLVERYTSIVQDSYVGANAFVQHAAVTALEHAEDIQAEWRATLRERRDALVDGVQALGFEVVAEPEGAFYVFARLPEPHRDSADFALRLLDSAAVAVTPGSEFGPSGEGCVRFSYSTSADAIAEGLERIEHFLRPTQSSHRRSAMEPETGPGPQELIFEHAQGYFVSKALVGIWRLGLWDQLESGELDVNLVAERDGYDVELLDSTLSYLVTRGYLERRGPHVYVLSALGKDSRPFFGYMPHLVGAYEPIFARLEDVLKGEVRYGEGVQRIERELAVAVGSLWEKVFARLASVFAGLDFGKVLDMGSGSGQVLSQICSLRPDIRGVGVDWNVDAGAEARERVRGEGLEGRVELVQGDAANLRDLPDEVVAGVDLITAMFVMHEIFRQRDKAGVVECLRTVREILPEHGRFVMVDVSRMEADGPSATLFTPEYQLVHDFSNQRLASREAWEEMLDEAGLRIEQTVPAGICQAFCAVAAPKA